METEKVTLYFKQGSSDKVYQAALEAVENGHFVVNFAYGRRGATLTTGTKTKASVDYAAAKKIYDKLVKSKTAEGYIPGAEGPQYVHTDADAQETGIYCQLLNFIDEAQVTQFINDDAWWAQEKYDGKRLLLHKVDAQGETVIAINRTGRSVGAPDAMLQRAGSIGQIYLVDGEAVGETLFVFDLLEIDQTDLRSAPYSQRLLQLAGLGLDGAIVLAETAKTAAEKQQLYDRLKIAGTEGIVFKKQSAPYTVGRPSSGGAQVKCKFYATASVIVTKLNAARSVAVAVLARKAQTSTDRADGVPASEKLIGVGNVTIPPNQAVPALNAIIEVRYLYAYPDGSLYQATYLGVRDDLDVAACTQSQLKYKKELVVAAG